MLIESALSSWVTILLQNGCTLRVKRKIGIDKALGKASYLRRFLPGLAALSASLMELLKKKVEYKWEEVHRQSLCENKGDLSERPSDDGSNSR